MRSKRELVQVILEVYQPKTDKDIQDCIKDIFGPMCETMLQSEINSQLGY